MPATTETEWAWLNRHIKEPVRICGDCGVAPGRPHQSGCDVERCSACGGQWIACGHKRHDPRFSRWTGFFPGRLEADALGIDLNEFHARGLHELFFRKPT
jgi:hypothetical protein